MNQIRLKIAQAEEKVVKSRQEPEVASPFANLLEQKIKTKHTIKLIENSFYRETNDKLKVEVD